VLFKQLKFLIFQRTHLLFLNILSLLNFTIFLDFGKDRRYHLQQLFLLCDRFILLLLLYQTSLAMKLSSIAFGVRPVFDELGFHHRDDFGGVAGVDGVGPLRLNRIFEDGRRRRGI